MDDLISRQALCEYALNQKDKSVTPNDIMRFPSAQPEKKSVLIIKANVLMKKEQLEEYRRMFARQKEDGVVLLPNTFEAEYIPDDVEIRIEGQDERKEIQEGPADQDDI